MPSLAPTSYSDLSGVGVAESGTAGCAGVAGAESLVDPFDGGLDCDSFVAGAGVADSLAAGSVGADEEEIPVASLIGAPASFSLLSAA